MTYTELRAAIAANLTNQAALLDLLTVANVQTVERCAPGIPTARTYSQADGLSLFEAGQDVALGLYDDKSAPRTVDEVLTEFSPANVFAAQVYAQIEPAITAGGGTVADFFAASDAAANENAPLLC